MLLPIPEEVLQAQARDRALDLLLGGVGVSAAVASASFAAYMVVSGPIRPPVTHSAPIIALASPPSHAPRTITLPQRGPDAAAAEQSGGIDFDPTGSIPSLPDDVSRESSPGRDGHAVLSDFAVRDVFDGTALIEANGTLQMVRPGTVLPGAGTVQSLSQQGSGWVVQTSNGLILQRR